MSPDHGPSAGALPGARPVRAPRGAELTCRGWGQEAALRMLMNNLDPGGRGGPRRARRLRRDGSRGPELGRPSTRSSASCAHSPTTRRSSSRAASRSRVFRTHEWAPRVLIANSNLVGKWATWDVFRELEREGPDDVRPDDRRVVDLHRDPGDPPGHVRDVRRAGPPALRRDARAGGSSLTAGLGGMGGAQPLAVTMNDGVCLAIEVDEARARRRLDIGYVDRLTASPDEALALGARRRPRPGAPSRSRSSATRPRSSPAWAPAGERFDVVTDQTSAHDALAGYVPAEISLDDAAIAAPDPARRLRPPVDGGDGRPRPGDARVQGRRRGRLRLRQQPPGPGAGRPASRTPSTTRASSRRSSGRSSARVAGPFRWAALSRRPGRHRRGRTGRSSSCSPTTRGSAAGSRWPRRRSRSRACRPGSAGWATASGRGPALAFNELVAARRGQRADRHRPRPPRRGLRRLARTARRRRWPTAPTRSPTGRSSTRSSTPRPARRGSRSTTAAATGIGY